MDYEDFKICRKSVISEKTISVFDEDKRKHEMNVYKALMMWDELFFLISKFFSEFESKNEEGIGRLGEINDENYKLVEKCFSDFFKKIKINIHDINKIILHSFNFLLIGGLKESKYFFKSDLLLCFFPLLEKIEKLKIKEK